MSPILFRYIAGTFLRFVAVIFIAVITIYLVADYVDRPRISTGPNWVLDALKLYFHKAVVVTRQLAPAALLLGAGASISALRKNAEVVALQSLRFGPAALYLPVAICTAVVALGLIAFDEKLVVRAGVRIEQLTQGRFNSWGDWRTFNAPKQWFRTHDWILHLRGGDPERGYHGVTLMRTSSTFQLERRIDASLMVPTEGTRWRLENAIERTFERNGSSSQVHAVLEVDLGVTGSTFEVKQGRPEQMHLHELRGQIETRRAVGLPFSRYELALQDRFAYPLAAVPAALLAVALALRPNRKGNLTAALVEGLAVVMLMWGMTVVAKTLVISERLSPVVAAWLPFGTLVALLGVILIRRSRPYRLSSR